VSNKFWPILFGFITLFALGLFVISPMMGWWLPPYVSTFGGEADNLFYVILWVTAFFFVLTEGILLYNMWRSASETPPAKAPFVHGNHRLELVWTLVPAVLLVLLAVVQISAWARIKYASKMPKPDGVTQQLVVSARQWEWRVRYPNVAETEAMRNDPKQAEAYWRVAAYPYEDEKQSDEVHVANEVHCWKGNKVLIHLRTRDVLHSFFIPILRLKQDAVPGKSIQVWFEATDFNAKFNPATGKWEDGFNPKTGEFAQKDRIWDLACAEYCGTRHSMMKGRLFVHETREDYLKWLQSAEDAQNQRKE
jgi:cytochrome c oxidase subunit 2